MQNLEVVSRKIAEELSVEIGQVLATIKLLDEGATVPFIARYRKEITGSLDDIKLRALETRLSYLRELEDRRSVILESISQQGKLSDSLRSSIENADTKTFLEDLYLPYKPKRRTKAQIAKEAGLEPLALSILENPALDPEAEAAKYINLEKAVPDLKSALDGARAIIVERCSEDAQLLATLRSFMSANGEITSEIVAGKEQEGEKFADYFSFTEPVSKIPSHRILALLRGRNSGILNITIKAASIESSSPTHPCIRMTSDSLGIKNESLPGSKWLLSCARWAWSTKLSISIESDLFVSLQHKAEEEAISVFAKNLKDLLLAAPAGQRATIGLDPGIRTGVKVAVVDNTGKVLETGTIFPHAPRNDWDQSIAILAALVSKHNVELISIGNGTASRETDKLVADMQKRYPKLSVMRVMVSEAGASVYSASELASQEFPSLDVTLRGAVSIARRLQDPLAELVKIDPKAIGVGQYQHDVNQSALARSLDAVVEDCVNGVGVDLNTASYALLERVAGLNTGIARSIVEYRNLHGSFSSRQDLLKIARLGQKAFEQAAGFLRIQGGSNPLDNSAVHPEAYPIVESLLKKLGKEMNEIIGNLTLLKGVAVNELVSAQFGQETIKDILSELEKPGRDPRPVFKTASFNEAVSEIKDLTLGMILEGVVTNVTNFGAFVDIGVHQDGLVHISALSEKFVKDPREVVKAGDIVKVKVMEIEENRKRVGLTMRLSDTPQPKASSVGIEVKTGSNYKGSSQGHRNSSKAREVEKPVSLNSLGNAFAAAFNSGRK